MKNSPADILKKYFILNGDVGFIGLLGPRTQPHFQILRIFLITLFPFLILLLKIKEGPLQPVPYTDGVFRLEFVLFHIVKDMKNAYL